MAKPTEFTHTHSDGTEHSHACGNEKHDHYSDKLGRSLIVGYISAIIGALLFGSVSTVAKPIVSSVNPLLLAGLVYLISGAAITPVVKRVKYSIRTKDYLLLVITSICGAAIAPAMFFFGLKLTTAINGSLLSNGEIIFSILLALTIFGETLNRIGYIAMALVLVGVIIVTTNLQFDSSLLKMNAGNLFIVGATFFWALDNNISRILTHRIDITKIIQLKSIIGGTILLSLTILSGIPLSINLIEIPYILLLGVVGFAVSLYFVLQSFRRIGTTITLLLLSLSSVFGMFLAAIFLHERITTFQIIAVVIMLCGIYLIYRNDMNDKSKIIRTTRS
jgi:drug/metabolite transporter (DMT)-like permease